MPITSGHVDKILGLDVTTIQALTLLLIALGALLVIRWWTKRGAKGERSVPPSNGDGLLERRENCQAHISAVAELNKMVDHLHERVNREEGRAAMTETNVQMLQRAVTLNSEALQELRLGNREIVSQLGDIHEKQDVTLAGFASVMAVLPESKKKFAQYDNGKKEKTATQWVRELLAPAEASPGAEEV